MQGMVPLCGFGGVPYSAVRKAAPRNLLDNSDFTNLVAQADIGGNHGTIPYAADRWILDSGTVSYEAGVGLTLNGTIRQKLEFPPTGETSAFVGMASGAASISCADGEVTITSSGGVLKWAALYSGVYTDATMPEYQPKGYAAELAECQRYYLPNIGTFETGIMTGSKSATFSIPTPVTMRTKPQISVVYHDNAITYNETLASHTINNVLSIVTDYVKPNGVCIIVELSAEATIRTPVTLYSTQFNLIADL